MEKLKDEFPKIPGYKIKGKIGEGKTSTVYMGVHEKMKRKVAIKILKPALCEDSIHSKNLLREAEIVAALTHRNIVTIFDVGQSDNYTYIIMEYLGESLLDRLNNNIKLPGDEILEIIKQVAAGLHYAHSKGVLHRDLKPANILFREDGTTVIADFGLAASKDLTTIWMGDGMIIGTFLYMSPEQCNGKRGESASDIYSLGVILFEMLTGKIPYDSETIAGLLFMHVNKPVPVLPINLNRYQVLIDQMMAKDKDHRLQTGEEVIALIDELSEKKINTKKELKIIPMVDIRTPPVVAPLPNPISETKNKGKIAKILKNTLIGLSMGVFVIAVFLFFLLTDFKCGTQETQKGETKPNGSPGIPTTASESIVPKGGTIQFEPDGGESESNIKVYLSIKEPLKSSNDQLIDTDIYYTLDGSEPSKAFSIKYTPGEAVEIDRDATYIKAKLFSKVGTYDGPLQKSREYIIKSQSSGGSSSGEGLSITGGTIEFLEPVKNSNGTLEISLSYDPLRDSNGKRIPGDIRYTIDGNNPTANSGTTYKGGKPIVLNEAGTHKIRARVISRDGNYMGTVYSESYTVQKDKPRKEDPILGFDTVIGGEIIFSPPGGEYRDGVKILMDFESLRFSSGNNIDSEIYYTVDSSEPRKGNGTKYKTGAILDIKQAGRYLIKARVISKRENYEGPIYPQVYSIIKPGIETVYQLDQLSTNTQEDILKKTERIVIEVEGISQVKKNGKPKILLSISPDGAVRVEEISGIVVEPTEKIAAIKAALGNKLKFLPPMDSGGKSVKVKIWIEIDKVAIMDNKVIILRS